MSNDSGKRRNLFRADLQRTFEFEGCQTFHVKDYFAEGVRIGRRTLYLADRFIQCFYGDPTSKEKPLVEHVPRSVVTSAKLKRAIKADAEIEEGLGFKPILSMAELYAVLVHQEAGQRLIAPAGALAYVYDREGYRRRVLVQPWELRYYLIQVLLPREYDRSYTQRILYSNRIASIFVPKKPA